jgi:integrase/recombinase XerD
MRKAPKGCFWRDDVLWGRVKIGGRDLRRSLRTDDPKIARQRREQWKKRLVAGVHFGEVRHTFDEALVAWTPWIERQVGANTTKRYGVSLAQLKPFLAGKFLDEINGNVIADIVRSRNASNATIKRDLNALSSIMNFSIGQGWVESNPVLPRLRLIKERRDPIILPQAQDVDLMLARAKGSFAKLIIAARVTGARQEELAGARWSQLDLQRKRLTVLGKGNKRRVIDLTPFDSYKVFEELPKGTPNSWLFWHDRGERFKTVASRFTYLSRDLTRKHPEFRRFRVHDLRHLHAVEWLQSGRSLYDLQQRLGHTSIQTTEIYLQFLTPEEQRKVKGIA